ncbi:hypothetical protein J2128_001394 [Methanomicrobium sp. W14]|uniref:hypothetical protein n=1 Tax=Methanomicrobium sp. W14 TaxID=2817839 RepID=UPI001AE73AC3|nr:hypothetical protein [Methanomicrobium sp. W14]MBP2133440.1 hypothetical protein [Methanomicrobium sp. W14]
MERPGLNDFKITCPVCGKDCIKDAADVLSSIDTLFSGCTSCTKTQLRRNRTIPDDIKIKDPCPDCERRFIDDVMVHCHQIMREEKDIPFGVSLSKTGIPLVTPGFPMSSPPYLTKDSLVLQTVYAGSDSAKRIVEEVSEVKGVIKDAGVVPGVSCTGKNRKKDLNEAGDTDMKATGKTPKFHKNTLLAGCDVRCDVFRAGQAPFVIYKSQSEMHIEFPRGFDPKINSVGMNALKYLPETFIDACCGAGTLGISAALFGVNSVVFNDIWYPAVFWTIVNLCCNREILEIEEEEFRLGYDELKSLFGTEKPFKAAIFRGKNCSYEVYMGDYSGLSEVVCGDRTLAALDIFDKNDRGLMYAAVSDWKIKVGGDAFIP